MFLKYFSFYKPQNVFIRIFLVFRFLKFFSFRLFRWPKFFENSSRKGENGRRGRSRGRLRWIAGRIVDQQQTADQHVDDAGRGERAIRAEDRRRRRVEAATGAERSQATELSSSMGCFLFFVN